MLVVLIMMFGRCPPLVALLAKELFGFARGKTINQSIGSVLEFFSSMKAITVQAMEVFKSEAGEAFKED